MSVCFALNKLFTQRRQTSTITVANGQKPADVSRKMGYTLANSENYLLFENNCEQADDSHYEVSHAFITNMKIGNVAQRNLLCFQEHRTLNK